MGPITYTFEELVAHKESGEVSAAAVERLRREADKLLNLPTYKVVDIKLPRPSGNPHDFVSMGPYWWPNPDTPDGLPWVNRDGYVNPDTVTGIAPGGVYSRVRTLALACLYIGDNGYSEYASRQLYDWFINPETYMNPHGLYAQGIPGVCEGRGTGLISFGQAYVLFDGIGILECLGLIDDNLVARVKEWFVKFADWILTHEYGLRIDMGGDNHASWHDANLLATAIFTDRVSLKKNICLTAYEKRVKQLIKPDGSQPSELRRTKAMMYSSFNLDDRLGYKDYWGIDKDRGECILKSAVDFLYPYVLDPKSFPYQELYPERSAERVARLMISVNKRYPDEKYAKIIESMLADDPEWRLFPSL